ncbi:phage tail assembly chaperone [Sporosarcina psychrophila]|uniref:Phage portal protein n=1 Tax=Sporosarcina psychrophila TaxID=1476 RepID=A0ABV2KCP7_SPOPS
MSKMNSFLKGNVKQAENVSLPLDRFEEAIILRPLPSGESDIINDRCFVNKPGRKGKQERVFDVVKFNRGISVASFVYPDLNDAELQESYGARGAEDLYSKMFLLGEANHILGKVTEISEIEQDINEDIEEAKN